MLDVVINPPNVRDEYLGALNRSFGHWGDESLYRWVFGRAVGTHAPDLMVLRAGDRPVAGSAVTYRVVRHAGGELLAGIMTGSWTLPEARGQGAFARVIDESRRLVAERGGALLLAFVTHDNASRRRLVAAGCVEIPTFYVASGEATPVPAGAGGGGVRPSTATAEEMFQAHQAWQREGDGIWIHYPSAEAWASQFMERTLPVERVSAAGCTCLVERAATSDRVLWMGDGDRPAAVAALLAGALAAGRQLFFFTRDEALSHAGEALGMTARPGSLTVMGAAGDAPDLPSDWRLQGGDRM